MNNTTILIGLIIIVVNIGSANAITPISLDVNLLEDGANIDTSKLVTICYNTDDASTPPNPLPVSINTVDDLDPVEGPIYLWGLYDLSYDPCTSGLDCKSKICASFGIFSAGTDIIIQVEGYEDHTFLGVTSSVGPVDVDLTPTGTAPPFITVLHPNGGEPIPIGTQVQVSAHATDDTAVTSVTFSYSNNSGSDWNSIGVGTRVSGTDKDGAWNRTWNTNGLDAGSNYLIKAAASDGTSTREDQSDSTFSLTCTPPSAPALNDPGTTDTDGSYTVSWSSVSGATSYTLEEDTSGLFGSPTVVYSGSGMSKYITGRSDGTYYYRVKACNACGCSGWSNVGDIEVEIPDSDIIRVPEDYSTIQAAVDAASSGTTIQVSAGTYIENIVIGKDDLKLEGESKNITVIDGGGSGTCVRITAYNAEISGFMIKNGITGVHIESSTGNTIDNNRISDHCEGIYLSNSNNNTIAHNSITDTRLCFSGIHLSSSEDNVIYDNDLSDNRDGIYVYNSNNNLIYHNNLVSNTYQAYDNTGTNQWDNGYPSGGNYWSDYTGIDTFSGADQNIPGSDSIGDTHYGIRGGAGAYDRYPFMNMGGWIDEENIPPVASFTYSPLNPVVDQTIAFESSSSYDPDGQIVNCRLDLGDETVVDGMLPKTVIVYEYSSAGSYIVTLTVTDDYGATGAETKRIIVTTSSKGDLNHDNQITSADATIALELAATGGWDSAADVDGDRRITPLDALMIQQAAAGAIAL